MATIPLEDSFTDILGKAQRGSKLSDAQLAAQAGMTVDELNRVKGGEVNEGLIHRLAPTLNLGAHTLVASATKAWAPPPIEIAGLRQFNTTYEDMTVNFYLAWDVNSRQAVVFDTGANFRPAL